jgi:hypothetical protein
MYLKYNADLWDLSDVVEANRKRKNESSAAQARMARDCFAQKRDELRILLLKTTFSKGFLFGGHYLV